MPVDGHIGIDSFGIKAGGHSAERNVRARGLGVDGMSGKGRLKQEACRRGYKPFCSSAAVVMGWEGPEKQEGGAE